MHFVKTTGNDGGEKHNSQLALIHFYVFWSNCLMSDVKFCHSSSTITFFQPLAFAELCFVSYVVVWNEDKQGVSKRSSDGDVVEYAAVLTEESLYCFLPSRTIQKDI